MPLHRVRARMRFRRNQGLATWCRDNMAVRYGQAVHIREGEPAEEPPVNDVVDVGGGRDEFLCDLALADEAAAVDAVATLADPNVLGLSEPLQASGDTVPSWVDRHQCRHDEHPPQPCVSADRREGPA